jgi:hypothetical protein
MPDETNEPKKVEVPSVITLKEFAETLGDGAGGYSVTQSKTQP